MVNPVAGISGMKMHKCLGLLFPHNDITNFLMTSTGLGKLPSECIILDHLRPFCVRGVESDERRREWQIQFMLCCMDTTGLSENMCLCWVGM